MKLRYIVNPFSGLVRRQKGLADRLRGWIAEQRLDATLVLTDAPGHATDLARQAVTDGCERVIAVGGDGTVNEVGQGLVGRRRRSASCRSARATGWPASSGCR